MNTRPLYDLIVVKRIEEQETTHRGIVIPDSAREKPQEGEVTAIGKGKRLDDGTLTALDAKAGDRILFGKYSGNEIKPDGSEHIIMREDDVLGVLNAARQYLPESQFNSNRRTKKPLLWPLKDLELEGDEQVTIGRRACEEQERQIVLKCENEGATVVEKIKNHADHPNFGFNASTEVRRSGECQA